MFNVTPYLRIYSWKVILFVSTFLLASNLSAHTTSTSNTNSHLFFTNISSGGTIASDQTICFGEDPMELLSLSPAGGGDNTLPIEYLWMQSIPGVSGWEVISGATSPNYDPPALNQTTAFMRCARRLGFANYTGETNVVLITIEAAPIVFILEAPDLANDGEELTFTSTTYPLAQLTWDFGDGTTTSGSNVTHTYANGGTFTITLTAFDNFTGCSFSTSTEIFVVGPLPVELDYFLGESIDDKAVQLTWFTEREEDNNFFEVLKSDDGEHFQSIAFVEGNGTTDEGVLYEFMDDIPFIGTNYYQLRQVDFSGTFSFSPIVAVQIGKEGSKAYTLFPNPAVDRLNIRFKEMYDYDTQISIRDINRSVVKQFMLPSNTLKEHFDISDLAPGVYTLDIYSRKIRSSELFVKVGF